MKEGDTYVNAKGELLVIERVFRGGVWIAVYAPGAANPITMTSYATAHARMILEQCQKVTDKATVQLC